MKVSAVFITLEHLVHLKQAVWNGFPNADIELLTMMILEHAAHLSTFPDPMQDWQAKVTEIVMIKTHS